MKKFNTRITRSTVLLFTLLAGTVFSSGQKNENGKITSIEKTVSEFQSINIDNNFNVFIVEGTGHKVIIETEEQFQNNVVANVAEGCLNIFCYHKFKESKINNIFITVNELNKITVSGKCNIKFFYNVEDLDLIAETSSSCINLNLNSNKLNCKIFGKGNVIANGNFNELNFSLFESVKLKMDANASIISCKAQDMSEAKFSGLCDNLLMQISDEASIESSGLISKICQIEITHSGEAYVTVSDKLIINGEMDGYIEYRGEPELNIMAPKSVIVKYKKDKIFATGQ